MKNFNFIFFILLVLNACSGLEEKKPMNKLFSHDYIRFQSENETGIIDLDSVTNFSELTKKMGELACEGKVPGLRFEINDTLYHMVGFSPCPTSGEIGCYFNRNILFIRNDSIIIGYGKDKERKPIHRLKSELDSIMAKSYNFAHNENKVNPALIHFYVGDTYPISTTKKVLKEIADQFSAINSKNKPTFFEYTILFESYDITSIPPPPHLHWKPVNLILRNKKSPRLSPS